MLYRLCSLTDQKVVNCGTIDGVTDVIYALYSVYLAWFTISNLLFQKVEVVFWFLPVKLTWACALWWVKGYVCQTGHVSLQSKHIHMHTISVIAGHLLLKIVNFHQ